ncbi:Potassium transporter 19 [Acorus calamus]|uniref:Potassium transporter 19 n=1 Tax=Acorus calamus TaxID=4465 RepID=A0AAV9CX19_ACOCL|nr:Potassium transporter 19 [Acorus calamus]
MFVMTLTSSLLVLIMFMIWKSHMILIVAYILIFGFVELSYLSSVLYKFNEGGYLPLAFAALLLTTMLVSHYAHLMKHIYHSHHRLARPDRLSGLLASSVCAPGIAIFHSETVVDDDDDVPAEFERYVESAPAVHSVVVFVFIESRPVGKVVSPEERFVFRRVGHPEEMSVFRIQNDAQKEEWCSFEVALVQRLVEFVWKERGDSDVGEAEREVRKIKKAARAAVVHLVGESEVMAKKESSMLKRVVINYAYYFLRRNLREENEVVLIGIPYGRLLKVGMTYEV